MGTINALGGDFGQRREPGTAKQERKREALKTQPPSAPFQLRSANAVPYRGIDTLDPSHHARRGAWVTPPRPPMAPPAPESKTPAEISHLYELGMTSAAMSFHEAALENMQLVTALAPDHAGAWRAFAALLRLAGRDQDAVAADAKAAEIGDSAAQWRDAQIALPRDRLDRLDRKMKERLEKIPDEDRIGHLRDWLFEDPLDIVAMRYLADEEERADDLITAANVLERALAVSPAYLAARVDYAELLTTQRNFLAVLAQTDTLLAENPNSVRYRLLRADAAVHMERFEEAVGIFESVLKQEPKNPRLLNSYGGVLKTVGRREDSVNAYRTLLSVAPANGNAYFGLSELKANYLSAADVDAMRRHLADGIPDLNSRKCMAYALGQTLERARDYEGSFEAYAYGALVCQEEIAHTGKSHDPVKFEERLARLRATFTAESIAARAVPVTGARPAVTPIFVIGMPRAGSTLVEQILASHSLVEGTRELPVVSNITKKIAMSRALVAADVYPKRVLEFNRAQLDALGQECLNGIAEYRTTTLPYVIDKRPWNWLDAPFIHLILPQAKFIDIRRAPMAAGFAMFKQLLPPDAAFSLDLQHLGHYYRNYTEFMTYLEGAMPGQILQVSYENLVEDTETQIRRMLDYCGLPFEESCLRFWQTDRAVLTPSAEQVRRPIFRDALEQWRNYEPWLGPLKDALGDLAA
jgi:tetratricopeptide (TPR) repeat protein